MAYLDISLMLVAMREQPDAFSLLNGWLKHHPTERRSKVQADGDVIVDAGYGRAGLSVHTDRGRQLSARPAQQALPPPASPSANIRRELEEVTA